MMILIIHLATGTRYEDQGLRVHRFTCGVAALENGDLGLKERLLCRAGSTMDLVANYLSLHRYPLLVNF